MTDPVLQRLLAAVVAHPDDDGPRLAYADRCLELGDDDRAEFVRVQIGLARTARCEWEAEDGAPCPQYNARRPGGRLQLWCPACAARENALPRLQRRNQELLQDAVHWWDWLADIYRITGRAAIGDADACAEGRGTFAVRFRRGFVSGVKLPCADWMGLGPALVRAAPLEAVRLSDKEPTGYPAVSASKTYWRWFDGSRADGPDSCDPDELPSALWPHYAAVMDTRQQTWEHPDRADAEECLSAAALAFARAATPEAAVP